MLCDVERSFHRIAEGPAPGDDLFYDHCHLRPHAHTAVAVLICKLLGEIRLVSASEEQFRQATIDMQSARPIARLPQEEAHALERVARKLAYDKRFRFYRAGCQRRALTRLRRALELDPSRASSLLLAVPLAQEVLGKRGAEEVLRAALDKCPKLPDLDAEVAELARQFGITEVSTE